LRQAKNLSKFPVGRRILVIGGGMTAIDIATQTKLLGAEEVTIAYRRGEADMSASLHEQDLARTHGVVIRHWLRPKRLIGKKGKLAAVELAHTTMRNGKLVDTRETVVVPCDQLFRAIGQKLVETDLGEGRAKPKIVDGRIKVDRERRTSVKGVWAGGDCTHGGDDLTVVAVEDGKQAALSIHRFLSAQRNG
jgi:glutamate synthase (NADPH/NADH) small chain